MIEEDRVVHHLLRVGLSNKIAYRHLFIKFLEVYFGKPNISLLSSFLRLIFFTIFELGGRYGWLLQETSFHCEEHGLAVSK